MKMFYVADSNMVVLQNVTGDGTTFMNSMKIIIPLHFISLKKDSKRCCDTTTPESIHTKDESKRGSAFAFIFGVN